MVTVTEFALLNDILLKVVEVLGQLLDNILLDIEHQFLLYQYFHTNKFD